MIPNKQSNINKCSIYLALKRNKKTKLYLPRQLRRLYLLQKRYIIFIMSLLFKKILLTLVFLLTSLFLNFLEDYIYLKKE